MDYDKLPDMWTIWILSYDPFGLDYRVYTVKNVVEESPKIEYNDGVKKLFLYTGGQMGGTKALQDLLAYIQSSTTANAGSDKVCGESRSGSSKAGNRKEHETDATIIGCGEIR